MFSQYTPPSMEEAIRLGVQGINPTGPNLALATHGIASQLITQLADGSKKLNMTNSLRMVWVAGSAVVGAILLQDAKNKTDSALDAKDRQSASAAAPGMPPEDNDKEDKDGNKTNPKNRAAHERDKAQYRRKMERPHAEDPELKTILKRYHKDESTVDSGSTAAALRKELLTGKPVGNKYHTQKTEQGIVELSNWLKNNPIGRAGDRAAAENMLRDLLDAAKGLNK
jgi:hypothetical protein